MSRFQETPHEDVILLLKAIQYSATDPIKRKELGKTRTDIYVKLFNKLGFLKSRKD